MKFAEMPYERPDEEKVTAHYKKLVEKLEKADSKAEFLAVFKEINALRVDLMTTITLAQVRHTINTADPVYEEENSYWDEALPRYEVQENAFLKACAASQWRNDVSEDIPATFFQLADCHLKSFDEKLVPFLVQENQLTTQYGKLKASAQIPFDGKILNLAQIAALQENTDQDVRKRAYDAKMAFYAEHETEFDEIYDKLVKVRTQMAQALGYKDYVELGYLRMNRLDYDRKMVAGYRKQILEWATPLACEITEKQRQRFGTLYLAYNDLPLFYPDGDPQPQGSSEELITAAVQMYHEMSPETGKFIDVMVKDSLWDLESRPNKEMGGYETELFAYHVPFIFANFNGTSEDVEVLTHEAGHAFQTYMATDIGIPDIACPTMESAEIDSMSMEFFADPWMNLFFGKDADRYRYAHLAHTITFLPYGVLVDHFQEEVYSHPEWTPEERKSCWRRLERMYTPFKDYTGCELLEKGCWWYQQNHIFQSPFYYIDYTLAQVCAQEFYLRTLKQDGYWEDYKHLLKLGGTLPFGKLVQEAGIEVPFTDGCLERVMKRLRDVLTEMEGKI